MLLPSTAPPLYRLKRQWILLMDIPVVCSTRHQPYMALKDESLN
jgi:hypothetical protein